MDEEVEAKITREDAELISVKYPPHNDAKYERYLPRMERLVDFYNEKKDIAPERQANLFKGFIYALTYFITTARMYHKLTRELKEKAKEAQNDGTDITKP